MTTRKAGLDWAVVRPKRRGCRQEKLCWGGEKGGRSADESRRVLQVMTIKGPGRASLSVTEGGHLDAQVMA